MVADFQPKGSLACLHNLLIYMNAVYLYKGKHKALYAVVIRSKFFFPT